MYYTDSENTVQEKMGTTGQTLRYQTFILSPLANVVVQHNPGCRREHAKENSKQCRVRPPEGLHKCGQVNRTRLTLNIAIIDLLGL